MTQIKIRIVNGDAFTIKGDVLGLKFAQQAYGLDRDIIRELEQRGIFIHDKLPKVSKSYFLESKEVVTAKNLIFIGTPSQEEFFYEEIREFGYNMLSELQSQNVKAEKLIVTIHGPGFGLDEIESFLAQISGFSDSIKRNQYPDSLKEIIFVDRSIGRVERLKIALKSILPDKFISTEVFNEAIKRNDENIENLGAISNKKKKIFVAMPYDIEFDDIFHYGIQGAVNASGYLCERADLASYTGDVMNWVKKRIESADLVIADMTNANPNVYLEVGYAWGKNKKTLLIVNNLDELKFDVRGQKCISYKKIKELENSLAKELSSLY